MARISSPPRSNPGLGRERSTTAGKRSARRDFPNDPCIDELWGHAKIGWDSRSPRVRCRASSRCSIPASTPHTRTSRCNVVHAGGSQRTTAFAGQLPQRALRHQRPLLSAWHRDGRHHRRPHGQRHRRRRRRAATAGCCPSSSAGSDRGLLARLSTIAEGIDAAVQADADVINISAKWPVDSRAIASIHRDAIGGEALGRRLVVTGYATSLDSDDSRARVLPLASTAACPESSRPCPPTCAAMICSILRGGQMRRTAEFRHLAWTSW